MKVIMLKYHQKQKPGTTVEVNDARGRLWVGMGVAKKIKNGEINA